MKNVDVQCLGFDTSNYTTSAAVFGGGRAENRGKLLTVPEGALGLRQSDALFQHVKRLHLMVEQLRSDGVMVFSNTLSTMKYCADVPYADAIGAALNGQERLTAESYRLGQDTYLYLKNAAGKTVLTLRRHNMEFLNGNWLVTSINGKQIDDEECNIFIDIAELKTHGNTGCNYFNGDIYIDPGATNAIDFSNMGVTKMACPKTAQETAMLVALEEATTAIAGKNDNTVLLLDRNGKQVMTLKRIPLPAQED